MKSTAVEAVATMKGGEEGDEDVGNTTSNISTGSRGKQHVSFILAKGMIVMVAAVCFLMIAVTYNGDDGKVGVTDTVVVQVPSVQMDPVSSSRRKMTGLERLLVSEEESDEDALIAKIAEKLKPSSIRFVDTGTETQIETITTTKKKNKLMGWGKKDENNPEQQQQTKAMVPHQFLHLHHMKTGGTSIDHLLRCSMNRLKKEANHDVPYYSIHECSRGRFAKCLTDKHDSCRPSMEKAAVMSYCSALKYLDEFGWWNNKNEEQTIKAFTVLRNPVDRVWSMYRFQTKNCYKCTPLKDIYKAIDAGNSTVDMGLDKLCTDQLQNHEVHNLLSTEWPVEASQIKGDDDTENADTRHGMIQESIDNMKRFFTVIGITEDLDTTAALLGQVIPWMNHTTTTPTATNSTTSSSSVGTSSSSTSCQLPHANASPSNNRCAADSTHWDLPKQPDQETYDLIVKHNSMDMELYSAAVSYFELQKRAFNL